MTATAGLAIGGAVAGGVFSGIASSSAAQARNRNIRAQQDALLAQDSVIARQADIARDINVARAQGASDSQLQALADTYEQNQEELAIFLRKRREEFQANKGRTQILAGPSGSTQGTSTYTAVMLSLRKKQALDRLDAQRATQRQNQRAQRAVDVALQDIAFSLTDQLASIDAQEYNQRASLRNRVTGLQGQTVNPTMQGITAGLSGSASGMQLGSGLASLIGGGSAAAGAGAP